MLTAPNGKSTSATETATLAPDETLARTSTVAVDGGPKGIYTLTVSADDGSGASTAAAEARRTR
jgi:hypothetical protein